MRANGHKLTQIEEDSLVKWVLDLDDGGAAPRKCMVREMANMILRDRVSSRAAKQPLTVV
jgi:hypothetical protein